ncbi:hypothetical protein J4E91_008254 [Alternaria rosae]|nr:hypothetical protein J4E91_008254 [Alternaria rosae]
MVIRTIHDLNAQQQISPPALSRLFTDTERFSLADAVHLKLKLQALDRSISSIRPDGHSEDDITNIDNACKTKPSGGTVYVAGSERFYLVVKGLKGPRATADAYAEAYKNVLRGRPYANKYKLSGWAGPIPTFSEIRPLLRDIDIACDTNLESAFAILEERGMQLHNEVRKFFYGNRRMFIQVGPVLMDKERAIEYDDAFKCLHMSTTINPTTLQLLKEMEFEFYKTQCGEYYPSESWMNPMDRIYDTLKLERIRITFTKRDQYRLTAAVAVSPELLKEQRIQYEKLERFGRWFINQIPASVNVSWSREDAAIFFNSTAVEQRLYQAIQERALPETGQAVAVPGRFYYVHE